MTMPRVFSPNDYLRQQGMTLFELVVVLVLSVGVLAIVLQIFAGNKQSALMQDNLARMQESARLAVQTLKEDIRVAGFSGEIHEYWNLDEAASPQAIGTVSGECFAAAATEGFRWVAPFISVGSSPILIPPKLYGVDDMTDSTIAPFGGCLESKAFTEGTDVISVHYVGPDALANSAFAVTSGDLYLRANLFNGVMFRSNGGALPTLTNWSDGPNTLVFPVRAMTYYVRSCSNAGGNKLCDSGEDTIPTLVRKVLRSNGTVDTEVVAEGVAGFQLRYGVDTDSPVDGIADRYVDAGSALLPNVTSSASWDEWARVRTVRIWLLLRSLDKFPGYQDPNASYALADTNYNPVAGYRYQLFVTTVAVRNPSGDD